MVDPDTSQLPTVASAPEVDDDGEQEDCFVGVPDFVLVLMAVGIFLLMLTLFPFIAYLVRSKAVVVPVEDIGGTQIGVEPMGDVNGTGPKWPMAAELTQLNIDMALPPNITKCPAFGFQCLSQPSHVIGTHQRCDGFADCLDASDEHGCAMCQTAFSCDANNDKNRMKCVRSGDLCDGIAHCADGSDESPEQCKPRTCSIPETEFQCKKSGVCLNQTLRCDGERHCPDGEDEIGCSSCVNGALFCSTTNKCIPKWLICDGEVHCPDSRIDEMNCTCTGCSGNGKAMCKDSDFCIKDGYICDGIVDCPHGEDEHLCPATHPNPTNESEIVELDRVLCSDGRSYPKKYACGGLEKYVHCSESCTECDEEEAFTCSTGATKCISRSRVCDGFHDCSDGSDELNCTSTCLSRAGHFQCSVARKGGAKRCIRIQQRCDGFRDCLDGEDEEECDKCSRNEEAFYCKTSRTCLPSLFKCDGKPDCADNSDELNCTPAECSRHPFPTYLCRSESSQCFRMDQVCAPNTQCSNPTDFDTAFCANKARTSLISEKLTLR